MKVIVTKIAFVSGSLVYPSPEPIEVPEGTKGSWFVPADPEAAAKAKAEADADAKAKAKKSEPQALSELSKQGKSFVDVHAGKPADADAKAKG